jgi:hypothetical protein
MKACLRWLLVLCSLIATLLPQTAEALTDAQEEFWADNDILFYDPGDSSNSGGMFCGGGGLSAGSTATQQMTAMLLEHGFSAVQAAGIIGNAQQESGLWPLVRSGGGSGNYWGLFQWDIDGREAGLRQKMIDSGYEQYTSGHAEYYTAGSEASQNISPTVLADIIRIQVEYALSEIRTFQGTGWIEHVRATSSPDEAAEAFLVIFEGAIAGSDAQIEANRIDFWAPALGRYYQEAVKRREYANNVAGSASGNCGLVVGGMTVEQAQAWLEATGYNDLGNDLPVRYQLPGLNNSTFCGGSTTANGYHGSRANCVGFSTYFVRAWTSLPNGFTPVDGGRFVRESLLNMGEPIAYGSQPQPYSVFSGKNTSFGHTGVVVGVDETANGGGGMVITIEAGCLASTSTNGGAGVFGSLAHVGSYTFAQMAARYADMEYAYLMPFMNVGGF